jgi:predicted esterase
MSVFTALTTDHQLGGVVGMSCYLLLGDKLPELTPKSAPNKNTTFWLGHGEMDPLVNFEWGKKTVEKLKEMGFTVKFNSYK